VSAQATVRRAALPDLPALLQLEALFLSDQMSVRSLRRFISAPNAVFLVAESAGQVLGDLLLLTRSTSKRARIYSVVVAPQARGLGLAQKLVEASHAAASKLGCDAVSLEVRSDNAAARGLYAKLGYQTLSELPEYYDDGADGVRLIKTLS
jgi:ribosomal-protein-alanine N-acetyltransferase